MEQNKSLLTQFQETLDFDAGIFPWLDHITLAGLILVLAVTPLLRTKSKLDWLIIPMWVYTAIDSHLPFIKGIYPRAVYLTMESRQNELLALIALFVLIIKTEFNVEKMLMYTSRVVIALGFVAIFFNNRRISGAIPNKSMNGILTASLILYCESGLFFILGTIVVMLSKSSSALLSYLVVFFGSFMTSSNYKKVFFLCTCTGVTLLVTIPDILFAGDRFEGYRFFFSDFSILDWVIGKGPASFWPISVYRQAVESFHVDHGFLFWMHSDPLQFIYEYGLIMVLPAVMALLWIFQVAEKRDAIAISSILFGGLFYYPLHWPIHIFCVWLMVKLAYEKSFTYPSGPISWGSYL